jgi:TatA/E family protein of Tat protein translocase
MYFVFLSFGGGEIILVFIAVLVLFGANKIPDFAKTLGKGINEFRRATDEIKKEFREGTEEFTKDLKASQQEINEHVSEVKRSLNDPVGYDPYENSDQESNDNSITDTDQHPIENTDSVNLKKK